MNTTKQLWAAVALSAMAAACGDSDTGRSRVNFDVMLQSQPVTGTANEFGYTVELTRADLRLSRLAFFEGDPLFTSNGWRNRLADLFVSTAYAHPGHYTPGEALGDLLVEQSFDLLDANPQLWGNGNGVTGEYASAELNLGFGGSASIELEGTATGPAGTIPFVVALRDTRQLNGLTVGHTIDDRPFEFMVTVYLQELVQRMDFGRAASAEEIEAASGPIELDEETQPYNAFQRAATGNLTYAFTTMEIE